MKLLDRIGSMFAGNVLAARGASASAPVALEIPPVETPGQAPVAVNSQPLDKRSETIAGGPGTGLVSLTNTLQILGPVNDEGRRRFGDRLYDWMARDPIAGGAVDVLTYTTLANEIKIVPKVQPRPGREPETPQEQADSDKSKEVADLCLFALDRLETPIAPTLATLEREGLTHGCGLAEIVWVQVERGEFAGKLVPRAIKPKSRRAWAFAVDGFMGVKGIVGVNPTVNGFQLLPREKFVIATWGGVGGDPRGTSIYDRASDAWNFRVQLPREHFKFAQRFGSPTPIGILGPDASYGSSDGSYAKPEKTLLDTILQYRNGVAGVLANGDNIILLEPKTEGQVFQLASDMYAREMVSAILLQTRATMEAQHGSKADSQTGQDVMGNLIRFLRRWISRLIEWDILYKIALYNYGPDVADAHTPTLDLGMMEHQDLGRAWTGLAQMGYRVVRSQWPEIAAQYGLPVVSIEDIESQDVVTENLTGLSQQEGDEAAGLAQQQTDQAPPVPSKTDTAQGNLPKKGDKAA